MTETSTLTIDMETEFGSLYEVPVLCAISRDTGGWATGVHIVQATLPGGDVPVEAITPWVGQDEIHRLENVLTGLVNELPSPAYLAKCDAADYRHKNEGPTTHG